LKDTTGRFLTKALFLETCDKAGSFDPVFTLKDEDDPITGLPSLRRLFLEEMDPSEFVFAEKHLGGIRHWRKLCALKWFQPFVEQWREDLDQKLVAHGIKAMVEMADKKDSAAKWLAQRGWRQTKNPVGRPTKEDQERLAQDQQDEDAMIAAALKRLSASDED